MASDVAYGLRGRLPALLALVLAIGFVALGLPAEAWAARISDPAIAYINADERADTPPPVGDDYFRAFVTDPRVEEDGIGGQFGVGTTLTLTAPNGYEFDTSGAAPTATSNNGLVLSGPVFTSTQLRFTVLTKSTAAGHTDFSGLKIRPMTLAAATRGSHGVTISATVLGNPWNGTIAVALVSAGKPHQLSLSLNPLETPLNTNVTGTIVVRDRAGNRVEDDDAASYYEALTVRPISGSADPRTLIYSGNGVSMNTPHNGQAIISGQMPTTLGEIFFRVRNNALSEEIVSFVVSDGRNILLPSVAPATARWYEDTFPGTGYTSVTFAPNVTLTTDNRADGPSPLFAVLDQAGSGPVIAEGSAGQLGGDIIITPPDGWVFNTGNQVTATVIGSTRLSGPTVTATQIRFAVTQRSAFPGSASRIIFDGIAVQPLDCDAALLGDHYVRITASGLTGAVLSTVTMLPGKPATFEVSANPPLNGVGLYSTVTITGIDACGNPTANYVPAADVTIVPTAGNTAPATISYVDVGLTSAGGSATIAAGTPFNSVGQFSFDVANTAAETVTFTVAEGAVSQTVDVQWVIPTCTLPDGISIWVSADKKNVLILGTDGPDVINLLAEDVAAGAWDAGDPSALPDPFLPDPESDGKYLTINGEHCVGTYPITDPAQASGIRIVDGLVVTINALDGTDLISWVGLTADTTGIPVGVVVNAGAGDDTVRPGPGVSPLPGITGGTGRDILDYSFITEAMGGSGGQNAAGIVFVTPGFVSAFDGAVRQRISTVIPTAFEEIRGTESADTIRAADGVDTLIRGGAGDDSLYGGSGNDLILGEDGDDFLDGGAGNDRLEGGEGDDGFQGGEGDDVIECGAGDDGKGLRGVVDGGPGNDIINGGEGDDVIYGGDGHDRITGGDGDDILYGDDPRVTTEPIPSGDDYIDGGDGDDQIFGGPGNDQLIGGDGDDLMMGGDGNDRMWGDDGDDFMYGEDGDDIMSGGDGDDYLDGGEGNDAADGGPGTDIIIGGNGNDHIICGADDDGTPSNPVDGGPGDDIIEGGDGDDVLTGGSGRNVIIGGRGNDLLLSHGTYDVLDYRREGGPRGIDLRLNEGKCTDTYGTEDDVSLDFAIYRGTRQGDRMTAHPSSAVIFLGGMGNDTLIGSAQSGDILYGEEGNDTIFGDPPGDEADPTFPDDGGDDILFGGSGNDTIWGGPGVDEIYGDGDYVPQNFDEDRSVPNYYPDDQMIQLWSPGGGAATPWPQVIIEPQPIQAGGAVPPVYTYDSILDVHHCLVDYWNVTTVRNSFALPCTEFYSGSPIATLARVGVPAGNDKIYGGGAADMIAGGGGNDTIFGGTPFFDKDLPYNRGDNWNIDVADLIYGDYVCNRPAALEAAVAGYMSPWGTGRASWHDRYSYSRPNPVTLDVAPLLANYEIAPWEPTPTLERLSDGATLRYPIPPLPGSDPYDLDRYGGDDQIHGGFGDDVILGGGGNDRVNGNRDIDVIYGDFFFHYTAIRNPENPWNIRYVGRDDTYALIDGYGRWVCGADLLRGNEGTDYLFGGPGNDLLAGGDPSDPEGFSLQELPWGKLDEAGDVMQGNSGYDRIVGNDLWGRGQRNLEKDDIDRGLPVGTISVSYGYEFTEWCIDSGSQDTVDYSMVPPTSTGINVDLGNNVPGGWYTMGIAFDDGEGSIDEIYGIENVIGTRSADIIKGSTRSDEAVPYDLSGRYPNVYVTDAFRIPRFPAYPTHSNPPYVRNPLRWEFGYDNILLGEDGNDTLIGRRGADALCGGGGNDKIWGDGQFETTAPPGAIDPDNPATNGNDEIWGDQGDDEIYGEWGDDIIHGGAGVDFMSGGNGVDVLAYSENDDLVTDDWGSVSPRGVVVNLRQEAIDLALWGGLADLYAGYGWPLNPMTELVPPGGFPATTVEVPDDVTPGGAYSGKKVKLTFPGGSVLPAWPYKPADMSAGRGLGVVRAGGYYDVIVNRNVEPNTPPIAGSILNPDRFEIVAGTTLGDVIYGHDTAATKIYGDFLGIYLNGVRAGSNDILIGGSGNDELYGQGGDDVLEGRGGDDLLYGSEPVITPPGPQWETPVDWASYNDAEGPVTVNLAETGAQNTVSSGTDRLVEIQNVLGSRFADTLSGNWRVNILLGGYGDDVLAGRADHDIKQGNRTYITSDTLHGGPGNDIADYRLGNPAQVRPTAEEYPNTLAACPAPNGGDTCGTISPDGEGGTDTLVSIENIRTSDEALLLTAPAKKVISPGQSVAIECLVTGGDGLYLAQFDPTTTTKQNLAEDGRVLSTKKVAILVEPADQSAPATPFEVDVDIPDFKAIRTLSGSPAANGYWKFTIYARPVQTTSFRITITDGNDPNRNPDAPARAQVSRLVEVVVTQPLVASIEQPEYVLTAGQTVQIRGSVTGGVPPYKITWEADNGSQGTTLSRTDILIPDANPTASTIYTLRVQDSAPDSLSQESIATTKVSVLAAPSGGSVPSGSTAPTGGNGGENTGGQNNAQVPGGANEVSGANEAANTAPVAPMCGFGVTSWVVIGNLLLLAVMKRRRW